ncbi:hypothetical protein [Streptomyces sp. NPDC018833]|uniref:hypothetical protein n=1 Tax=Streptomyces sp. NPDC018833 TaxID=3365053 RepID=UPI0037A0DE86
MPYVVARQAESDFLQGSGDGADLSEDVDAVVLVVDHAGHSAHLALDLVQPGEVVGLVADVAVPGSARSGSDVFAWSGTVII